jgi:uncharacterized protein
MNPPTFQGRDPCPCAGSCRLPARQPGLLVCATALLLGACSSVATHYHSLTPIHQAIRPPQTGTGTLVCTFQPTGPTSAQRQPVAPVLLAHLDVPVESDRMQLLLHQTATRLSVYETERWAAPLEDQISNTLIENLRDALPELSITRDPLLIGPRVPLKLNMEIEELDALAGKDATVRARWTFSGPEVGASQTGACTARQPLQSTDIDELVLAWSRALADISSALAASIPTR